MSFYKFNINYYSHTHNKSHLKTFTIGVEYDPQEEGLAYFRSLRAYDDIEIQSFSFEPVQPQVLRDGTQIAPE